MILILKVNGGKGEKERDREKRERDNERVEKKVTEEKEQKKKKKRRKREEKGGESDRGRVCTHARRQRDVSIVRCILTVYRHTDSNIIRLIDSERKAVYV